MEVAVERNAKACNTHLTERQSIITGSRWCMSCATYRRADNGSEKIVDAGLGRRKRMWRCAVCTLKLNGRRG